MRKLSHPNIVRYVERLVDPKAEKIYIVMEYCQKGDMSQHIKRLRRENDFVHEDVVWKIFSQLLLALRECHYKGIPGIKVLHRDLKPSNIFFDSNDNIKLGDFGLARLIKEDSPDAPEEDR